MTNTKSKLFNRAFSLTLLGAIAAFAIGIYFRATQSTATIEASSLDRSTPVAVISPAPTNSPSVSETQTQVNNGVELGVTNIRIEGKRLLVDVCYTMLDDSDWTIWKASLNLGDRSFSTNWGTELVERNAPAAKGLAGRRCDILHFDVPSDVVSEKATITIEALAAQPREGEYCAMLQKAQRALDARAPGITIQCSEENGYSNAIIVSKPDTLTQAEAEALVFSDEWFTVKGPWVFTADLGK